MIESLEEISYDTKQYIIRMKSA